MSLIVDPSTLTPTAWYIADNVTGVDGASVATWPDSSGNGYDLSRATGANQPKVYLNVRNGKRGVLFDGTDDSMFTATANLSSLLGADGIGTSIAVVGFDAPNATTNMGIWGANVTEGTQLYLAFAAAPKKLTATVTGTPGGNASANPPLDYSASYMLPDTQYHVVCWQHDSTPLVKAWNDNLDDVAAGTGVTGADAGLANAMLVGLSKGTVGVDRFYGGYILELIFFNTVLTQAQRQGVQLYLTNKYALAYGSGVADEGAATAPVKVEMKLPSSSLTLTPSAWFKADALASTNTAPVSAWADSSTEGHNLAQAASTSQPVYYTNIINGKPAVLFKGRDFLATTGLLSGILSQNAIPADEGDGTVYAVARPIQRAEGIPTNHSVWSSIHPGTSAGSGMIVAESSVGLLNLHGYFNDGTTYGDASVSVRVDKFGIFAWRHFGVNSFVGEHVPGFDVTSTGMMLVNTTGLDDLGNNLYVGAGTTGTYNSFYLAELLFFRETHETTDRRHVHAYLAGKYAASSSDITYFAYGGSTDYEPVWVDVTTDIRATDGLSFNYGIDGNGPEDRVASAGKAQFSMENSAANSAGLIGYYSPDSTTKRMGWGIGVPVRISFDYYGTTYVKWLGQLTDLLPSLDRKYHVVRVTAMDYVDELARTTLDGLAVATNKRADEAFASIFLNMDRFPSNYVIGEGSDVYPYVFDTSRDERAVVLAEMRRLALSEFGFVYLKGDTDVGGKIVFESRGQRDKIVRWAITEPYIRNMEISYGMDDVVNRARVRLHPRRVDASTTPVLFSLGNVPVVNVLGSLSFSAPYRDPSNGRFARVGGMDMISPASTTDFTANSSSGGGGASMTTDMAVTATFGGNSADITITNNVAANAYLTKFQLRGRGLYSFEEVLIKAQSTPSIDKYGANTASIDMPYQSDANLGYQVAMSIVANNKDPRTRVSSITLQPNESSVAMMQTLNREPGDRVTITETISGLSTAAYHIQGAEFRVRPGSWLEVDWALAPAAAENWSTS